MDQQNKVRLFRVTAPSRCLDYFAQQAWLAGADQMEQHNRSGAAETSTALFAVEAAHVEGFLSLARRNNVRAEEQAHHETAY